jgi:hypothetical protein
MRSTCTYELRHVTRAWCCWHCAVVTDDGWCCMTESVNVN